MQQVVMSINIMMTTEKCDVEMELFKAYIFKLKCRYQTLKTFREFGSQIFFNFPENVHRKQNKC